MWCDIHYQATPIVPPKPCPHGISAIVPAKHVCKLLLCRSNCFHSSSCTQVSINTFLAVFLVRGQATTHEFPRNSETCLQKCIACKWLCFHSVLLNCQSSNRHFIAVDAIVHSAVYIPCWDGFQWDQMCDLLRSGWLSHHEPVYIIFLSRNIVWNMFYCVSSP